MRSPTCLLLLTQPQGILLHLLQRSQAGPEAEAGILLTAWEPEGSASCRDWAVRGRCREELCRQRAQGEQGWGGVKGWHVWGQQGSAQPG